MLTNQELLHCRSMYVSSSSCFCVAVAVMDGDGFCAASKSPCHPIHTYIQPSCSSIHCQVTHPHSTYIHPIPCHPSQHMLVYTYVVCHDLFFMQWVMRPRYYFGRPPIHLSVPSHQVGVVVVVPFYSTSNYFPHYLSR